MKASHETMNRASGTEIRRYLLGELDQDSATAIERRYFADPALVEEIAEAEHDLVDDYVAGGLAPAEREHFEHRYPTTPARAERLATAKALGELARKNGLAHRSSHALGWRPAVLWWMGAAAALVLSLGLWFLLARQSAPPQQAGGPGTVQPSPAPPPSTPVPETPAPRASGSTPAPQSRPSDRQRTTITLMLSPVLTRSESDAPQLTVPAGADLIELQLLGDREMTGLAAQIRSVDAGVVWSGRSGAPPRAGARGLAAIVTVPAERLTPDDYIVTLAFDGPEEQPLARYYFRVVPRR